MSKQLLAVQQKIAEAKACSSLKAAKKVQLAEQAVDGAIELITEIMARLESLENALELRGFEYVE